MTHNERVLTTDFNTNIWGDLLNVEVSYSNVFVCMVYRMVQKSAVV